MKLGLSIEKDPNLITNLLVRGYGVDLTILLVARVIGLT